MVSLEDGMIQEYRDLSGGIHKDYCHKRLPKKNLTRGKEESRLKN